MRRAAASDSLLGAIVAVGSVGIVAAPAGCLWLAARIGGSNGLALAVLGAPAALVLWALALAWLNRIYVSASHEPRRILDLSVSAVVALAVAGTLIWMLVFGHDLPLRTS